MSEQKSTPAVHDATAEHGGVRTRDRRATPPGALVVSHARSGTHFLINTLSFCYGQNLAWIDFDCHRFPINFHAPEDVLKVLQTVSINEPNRTVKSHHSADFFLKEISSIADCQTIFYIHRDPVDVLLSYWRLLHRWSWEEGPKVDNPVTFARTEPAGRMLRHQMRQYPNMMVRWAAHVEGWLAAAQREPRIVVVRYEDLHQRFEEVARGFAGALKRQPKTIMRPSREFNVIAPGPQDPSGRGLPIDREGLRALCRETIGSTMARLGY